MKYALLALLLATPCFAEPSKEKVAEHKQKLLTEVDQEISSLQQTKSCIQAATTPDAFHECRKQQRERRMADRKSDLDDRIKRLQEHKAKMGNK